MALSMEQVRRKCYRVGEKHVINQYFSLIFFLTLLLPLHKLTNEEPTNCSLSFKDSTSSRLRSESLLISTEFKYIFADFRFVAHASFHWC